jgi:lysophospholipase L1-like esterase
MLKTCYPKEDKMNKINLIKAAFLLSLYFLISGCSAVITKYGEELSACDADDPNIIYVGRVNNENPKNVIYDWPGVHISAKFNGSSCFLRLKDHGNLYSIIVDNNAPVTLKTGNDTVYNIYSGLPDSIPHSVTIHKRTEAFLGKGEFRGFFLEKGRRLLKPDPGLDRRIEFIGNSITCGYGVEGPGPECHFTPETENAYMSYASITAREMGAEYSLIAYSGKGVVRNYGDKDSVSKETMPDLYDRICYGDSVDKWNFNSWKPQVVVINLGTNDYSTKPFPDKLVFKSGYKKLINRVRALYPGVLIFCICGPMIEEPCFSYINEVVTEEGTNKNQPDIFFVGIHRKIMSDSDWGCDSHPNMQGMRKMADLLIAEIRRRMNWILP